MPAIEQEELDQYAVLWPLVRVDKYGEEQFGLPQTVPVRWIWKKSKVTDAKGNTTTLDVQMVADREILLRSVMWVGITTDPLTEYMILQAANTPSRQVCRVETDNYTPDLKGRETRYEFLLKRYKDLPLPVAIGSYGGSNLKFGGSMTQYGGAQ